MELSGVNQRMLLKMDSFENSFEGGSGRVVQKLVSSICSVSYKMT